MPSSRGNVAVATASAGESAAKAVRNTRPAIAQLQKQAPTKRRRVMAVAARRSLAASPGARVVAARRRALEHAANRRGDLDRCDVDRELAGCPCPHARRD